MSRKRTFSYDILYDMYIDKDMTSDEMRKELRCGNSTVLRELNKYGLVKFKKAKTSKMSNSRLYRIYQGMKTRCYNENDKDYKYYGGRGIEICDEWLNSFNAFHSWATNNGYNGDLSIDRLDNDGDYTPDNCRWATPKQQSSNQSSNLNLKYKGEDITVNEIHKLTGLNKRTIRSRLDSGWEVETIINTPTLERKDYYSKVNSQEVNQYTLEDQFIRSYKSIREASKSTNTSYSGISDCINGKLKTSGGYRWERK